MYPTPLHHPEPWPRRPPPRRAGRIPWWRGSHPSWRRQRRTRGRATGQGGDGESPHAFGGACLLKAGGGGKKSVSAGECTRLLFITLSHGFVVHPRGELEGSRGGEEATPPPPAAKEDKRASRRVKAAMANRLMLLVPFKGGGAKKSASAGECTRLLHHPASFVPGGV